jgi:hypothetical protein
MSNTTVFHQIVQSSDIELPKFDTKREDGLWTASCVFRDVYYLQTDPQLKIAKDKVFGAILADTALQPKLAGSIAKRDLLDRGWTIEFNATLESNHVEADVLFTPPSNSSNSEESTNSEVKKERFWGDSIGSLDRFIKSTCATILAQSISDET